jgi:hypothetical protein
MVRDFQRTNQDNEPEFLVVEETLQSAMRPVIPSQEFIKGMRRRLVSFSEPGIVVLEDRSLPFTLWVLAGILSGVVLLVIVIRGMLIMRNAGDRSRSS